MALNRSILIVRPKQPLVDWVNSHDEPSKAITLDEALEDPNAYLVPPIESHEDLVDALVQAYEAIFENELDGWYTDESLWPQQRDWATFSKWFDLELLSVVHDLCDGPVEDDED